MESLWSNVINNIIGFGIQRILCYSTESYLAYRDTQINIQPIIDEYRNLPRVTSMTDVSSNSDNEWINLDSNDL